MDEEISPGFGTRLFFFILVVPIFFSITVARLFFFFFSSGVILLATVLDALSCLLELCKRVGVFESEFRNGGAAKRLQMAAATGELSHIMSHATHVGA